MNDTSARALKRAGAMFVVDRLSSEGMVEAASAALDSGLEAPALMALALLARPDARREGVLELSQLAFAELGLGWPTIPEAVEILIRDTATKIVQGSVGPYEGATNIWNLTLEVKGHLSEYDTFLYAASEWHDRPDMHAKFAEAVVEAARDVCATPEAPV